MKQVMVKRIVHKDVFFERTKEFTLRLMLEDLAVGMKSNDIVEIVETEFSKEVSFTGTDIVQLQMRLHVIPFKEMKEMIDIVKGMLVSSNSEIRELGGKLNGLIHD